MNDLNNKIETVRKWIDGGCNSWGAPSAEIAAILDRAVALQNLTDRLKLEAQIHVGEARGANATIHEAYQAVTEGKGEPGNWNGSVPIKEELARLRDRLTASEAAREKLEAALAEAIEPLGGLVGLVAGEVLGPSVEDEPDSESVGANSDGPLPMTFGHVREAQAAIVYMRLLLNTSEAHHG